MVLAIPSMLSIIGLMMIWVFVYAGIGTQVFPYVKYGRSLNKDANFETFPNSFLVLFQCLTVRLRLRAALVGGADRACSPFVYSRTRLLFSLTFLPTLTRSVLLVI